MFSIKTMTVGLSAPFEHLPVTASETITPGEALVLSSGKLTKCGATAKPAYIAMGPADENGSVPCTKVLPSVEYQTTLSVDVASSATLYPGDKVTLSADGLEITATKTSGVATISRLDGTTAGSLACVRFE